MTVYIYRSATLATLTFSFKSYSQYCMSRKRKE